MAYTRYECSAPGYESNWAEIADRWTRREIVNLRNEDEVIPLLQEKIGACHLESDVGAVECGPEITEDAIFGMVAEVHGFLLGLPTRVWAVRSAVGNVSARASSPANGTAPITATMTAQTTAQ